MTGSGSEIPWLDDDGGPMVVAVEAGDRAQALWVRVGPVFGLEGRLEEPGIWVEYQEHYLQSHTSGPVLLDPGTWRRLAAAVDKRLARYAAPVPWWRRWLTLGWPR